MRMRAPDYPSSVRDTKSVYNTGCGKKNISRKGTSNNKVKGKVSASGIHRPQAIQIEESAKGTPMEKASVCIS